MNTLAADFTTRLAGEVGTLPHVAAAVVTLAADPECSLPDMTRLILSDNVMAMRFLALANSAAYSRGQEVRDLRGALVRLGLRRVRNIAFLMGMHDLVPRHPGTGALDLREFWKYSLAVAGCAQALAAAEDPVSGDDAWLVGILHGIGVPFLAQKEPEKFRQACELARAEQCPLVEAEARILGFDHRELGHRLMKTWGLPTDLAETVAGGGGSVPPWVCEPGESRTARILRRSIALVRMTDFGENGDGQAPWPPEVLLPALGLQDQAFTDLLERVDREVEDLSRLLGIDLPEAPVSAALAGSPTLTAEVGLSGLDQTLAGERYAEELNAARAIQQRLLPGTAPDLRGFDLAACNRPARVVSGDFYDFLALDGGRTGLAVADISGKGLPAALLAGNLQACIRALAPLHCDPGELLGAANAALFSGSGPEEFATLFLAVVDPGRDTITYASAGAQPPILIDEEGKAFELRPTGPALGLIPDAGYPSRSVILPAGGFLIAFTDGLADAGKADPGGGIMAALLDVARGLSMEPASVMARDLPDGFRAAVEPVHGSQDDDLTLLVLKRPISSS
ncbi:HDOD domain-containing protein [bacterium]|nr:HDOD domain-containing protein [bacterium]